MLMLTSLASANKTLILPLINLECLKEFPENKSFNKYLMAEGKEMHVFHVSYINCIRAKFLSFLSVAFGLDSVLAHVLSKHTVAIVGELMPHIWLINC